jgi:hypothetical protein
MKTHKPDFKKIGKWLIVIIASILAGFGIRVGITETPEGEVVIDISATIELASEQKPATIETSEGEIEIDVPTVELVESKQTIDEGELDFGRGEYHDISTPESYKNSVLGKCIDLDGKWGSQCVDGFADFNYQYTGRWLSTCGTGSARGLWDCAEYNAGSEYELITDPLALQAGDWIIFNGGQYGHVGMAMGYYNNGYITLLGENQGGTPCAGGGSAFNIINMSLKTFKGAFRPNIYIKPEPVAPIIPITGCVQWYVEHGDTMSKIMLECENTVVYGEPMNEYARSWYSMIFKPGQSVYDGWMSESGVGLYAGDEIEHKVDE